MRVLFVAVAVSLATPSFAQQVGDYVLTRPPGVELREGDAVVASVPAEKWLKVVAVEEGRLRVKYDGVSGFVKSEEVVRNELLIEYYSEKIAREPTAADLRSRAGWHYRNADLDLAFVDLNDALRLDPNNAEAYADRAFVWTFKRDSDRALADFGSSLRIDPSLVRAYDGRAAIWAMRGEYDKAFADLEQSIRLKPDRAHTYEVRGMLRLASCQTEKAMADLDEALRLDPDGPTGAHTYAIRGRLQEGKKHFEEAVADFNEAIRIDPRCEHAHGHLAWLLATCPDARFRNGPLAVRHAETSCRLTNWKNVMNFQALAAAHAECGDFHSAIVWQHQSIELTSADQRDERDKEILALYESGKPYRQGHFSKRPLEAPKP